MPPPKDPNAHATAIAEPGDSVSVSRASVSRGLHPADSLQARLDPSAGPTRLGRYVLLREIGRGAIGVVYAAYHEGLDRKLAIKVLNKQRAGRADLEARLRREARALAKLSHPNVVQVYDVGEFEGRVFVAMEFVDGEPLTDWMRRQHSIPEIVAMFADAGRGLAAAHEAGVVHRDFKPDNVLVGRDGRPRVLDFGLARAVEHDSDEGSVGTRTRMRESGPLASSAGASEVWVASLDDLLGGARPVPKPQPKVQAQPVLAPRQEPDPDATATADAPPPRESSTGDAARASQEATLAPSTNQPVEREASPHAGRRPSTGGSTGVSTGGSTGVKTNLYEQQLVETMASTPGTSSRDEPELADTQQSEAGFAASEDDEVLTRTGAMMGTPAYMSPEQFLGQRVDQASDQFSFCIALHEALYGRRPFAGRSSMDLALATQSGRIVEAPPNSPVPTWLREILLRGLQASADARFESMNDLIAELVRDREPPRRRWPLPVALGALAATALTIGLLWTPDESPCPSLEQTAAEQWSDERASELRDVFARSPLPYANAAWAGVEPRLRGWIDGWAAQRVEACEATHVRHEFSTEVLDLRQACLERELRSFEALIEQLRAGDPTVIEHALEATVALPEPARCADVDALLSGLAPPPDAVAAEVEQLRATLAELDALANTGRWRQGLPSAELAVERARKSGYGPIIAEALLTHARLLAGVGSGEQAVEQLQDALDEAERSGHDSLVPRVAIELVSLSIYAKPDPIRGRVWARRALASLDHIEEHGYLRTRGTWILANLDRLDGAYEPAEKALREAISLLDAHAPNHPDRGAMLNDLGVTIAARGEIELARETYSEALRDSVTSFGNAHPRVGNVYFNLARLEFDQQRLDEARTQLDHARRIYVDAHGPRHRDVGSVEMMLAAIDVASGRLDQAKDHATLAEQIYAVELAADNVDRAEPRLLLGHIAFAEEQYDQAAEHYRAGLALQQAALPPGHISMADTHTNLGLVQLLRGDHDDAVAELERAVDLLEAGTGVAPAKLRMNRLYLGDALLARDGPGDARHAARRLAAALEGCEGEVCSEIEARMAKAEAALAKPL